MWYLTIALVVCSSQYGLQYLYSKLETSLPSIQLLQDKFIASLQMSTSWYDATND